MLPEISRRCLVCGASVRAGAHFCSQCGNNLTERGGEEVVSPEVQSGADARGDVQAAASETAREATGGEEVARAFETWRGGEAVAGDDARRAHEAESAAGDGARSSAADEAARPSDAARTFAEGEAARTSGAGEPSLTPFAGGAETPRARGPVMPKPLATQLTPEPVAAQSSPAGAEVGEDDAAASSRSAGAVGATRRRAASVVKESIAPRVERVRDRSIVMLEEAPDDSGLRFVLIAAFMFALFIFLLVLSTFIK